MPKASIKQIAQVVIERSEHLSNEQLVNEIASFVITERRTADLSKIMREVERQRQLSGLSEVTITTAYPATEDVKAQIKQILGGEELIINEVVDKNVIGGVRVESDGYFLDLTVRGRLERLKTGVNE